jgi:hypothetical protein
MTSALIRNSDQSPVLERVILQGDLSKLSPEDKVSYYGKVCESVGLNPLTKPFDYLRLNNKEVLYATKGAAEQLRAVHHISVDIVSRELIGEVYVVTAKASEPSGRYDESTGATPVGSLKGESLANAYMKAETKAKRRVTLSICGLNMLDETEVESIPRERPQTEQTCSSSRSAALALRVSAKSTPPVDIDAILAGITNASTMAELESVGETARGLGGGARERVAQAYRERRDELREPPHDDDTGEVTEAQREPGAEG